MSATKDYVNGIIDRDEYITLRSDDRRPVQIEPRTVVRVVPYSRVNGRTVRRTSRWLARTELTLIVSGLILAIVSVYAADNRDASIPTPEMRAAMAAKVASIEARYARHAAK